MTVTGDGNVPATPIEEGEQQVEKQEIQKEEDTMYNDEEGEQQVQVQKQEIQEEDMMYNDHHDSGAAAPVNANGRKQKQHVVQRRTGVTAEAAPYDISYRPGRIMLYSPIRQRQKWGDTQVLPRKYQCTILVKMTVAWVAISHFSVKPFSKHLDFRN
jgi:hypothetical protein